VRRCRRSQQASRVDVGDDAVGDGEPLEPKVTARAMLGGKPKVLASLLSRSHGEANGDGDAGGDSEPLEPKSEAMGKI
jgi:hypothetical protein